MLVFRPYLVILTRLPVSQSSPIANNPLQQTRFALLGGEFSPGQKLKPDALRLRYNISASSMREVLLRLAGEGLVEAEDQRGFSVPDASFSRMSELLKLRALIECEGARGSILQGDLEWEARLNAAHHKLSHIEQRLNITGDTKELLPIWTRADDEFHQTLVDACGSQALIEMRANLFQRARQQVVACDPKFGFRVGTVPEHNAILEAALARDIDACEKAIHAHMTSFQRSLQTNESTLSIPSAVMS